MADKTPPFNLKDYIEDVIDFPHAGIVFRDITPLLSEPSVFEQSIKQLAHYVSPAATHIVAIEARGFIFGVALARYLHLPFIPIRKQGKLPRPTISIRYQLEYAEATIELHQDALDKKSTVVLVDDLIATGGTLTAAVDLIQQLGANIERIVCLIELTALNGRQQLGQTPVSALIKY